jgi:hypothetical protein
MCDAIPKAPRPWYCDDAGAADKAVPNARCLDFLMKCGPTYSYFPVPMKSYYICKAKDEDVARAAFEGFGLEINYSRGQRHLGGFIGSALTKEKWLADLVVKWVGAVETLSTAAAWYPQTAYTGFTFCLQNEWQYVQQVVANTAPSSCLLRQQSARASCRLSLVSHHQPRSMVNTASSSPTASSWVGWQSATLWTLL